MTLTNKALTALSEHWAIKAIGQPKINLANELVHQRLARQAVGDQISFSFEAHDDEESRLEDVAEAFDLVAIEGLEELCKPFGSQQTLRDQAMAASFKSFDVRRLQEVPSKLLDRMLFVLQLSASAYCGDRWSDLRRWYKEHDEALQVPTSSGSPWDHTLLYQLFDCWIRLFRKDGWEDISQISAIVAGLRRDQEVHEEQLLSNDSIADKRAIAFRLISLYNWVKATESLAVYTLEGEPAEPLGVLDKHFEAAIKAAARTRDIQLEIVLRWLHSSAHIMVTNSLWWATRTVNSKTSKFVHELINRKHQAMFELLPPQRVALLEQGFLDPAKTAIVIDMPTSGGKTLLAQFRILQALNQFKEQGGWVAYVAPTRALSAQITRRLRADFGPIDLRVEQLTAAVDLDSFEEKLLKSSDEPFDVLVATPEKLSLVIRNKTVVRPLALVVMDEAHNMESESRGLRIELLLATVKRDCIRANFLLLMPYVEETDSLARWLGSDESAGNAISLGTVPWKPNERIIGLYRAVPNDEQKAGWHLEFETLTATDKAMPLHGTHRVGAVRPFNEPKSTVLKGDEQQNFSLQTAAISSQMAARGTSIAVMNQIPSVWKMANLVAKTLPKVPPTIPGIELVQDFLRTEISEDFELVNLLEHGVGVHHAGLSDEVRSLMEWLAEIGSLRVLCATSTIAQGINFPVSSVFLASRFLPSGSSSIEMPVRDFWNLAGRAGRIGQDSVGVIGLSQGRNREETVDYIRRNTGALVSRLEILLDELVKAGSLARLSEVMLYRSQWNDFRCYIAHLWAEKKNLDAVLSDTEQLLRQTYGYTSMRSNPSQKEKADALLAATKEYARRISRMQGGVAELADSTGFSPEGVQNARNALRGLDSRLSADDLSSESLFGRNGRMAELFGVMLKVPELKQNLEELRGLGSDQNHISQITNDWINGEKLKTIATRYFKRHDGDDDETAALTNACKAIYRNIVHTGSWGVSALSRVSDINFDRLTDAERRRINALPAMIYHGVKSEEAVLMRMNSAPRSSAEALGSLYRESERNQDIRYSVGSARKFLSNLNESDWHSVRPAGSALSGKGFKNIWEVLSGEVS